MLVRSDGRPTYNFASPVEDWRTGSRTSSAATTTSRTRRSRSRSCARSAPTSRSTRTCPTCSAPDGKKLSKRHGAVAIDEFRAAGLRRAGADELPRPARLELRRQDDDHVARGADRALHARARGGEPGDLRLREARLDERRLPAGAAAGGVRRRARRVPARARLRLGRGSSCGGRRRSCRRRSRGSASSRRSPASSSTTSSPTRRCSTPSSGGRARALAQVEPWRPTRSRRALRGVAERLGQKPRQAFQPIRVAVTGSKVSPGLFESLELLGRDESLARNRPVRG